MPFQKKPDEIPQPGITILAGGPAGPTGSAGADGADGADGVGVPVGGATGEILAKASAADNDTVWNSAATVRTFLNVENGATADQTPAEILAAIVTVDGAASGLDADLLDGQHAAAFEAVGAAATAVTAHETTYDHGDFLTAAGGGTADAWLATKDTDDLDPSATRLYFTSAEQTKLAGIETAATADQSAAEILAALLTVDGAGSGLDADLLDGSSSAAFATASHVHAAADITSGEFGTARYADTSVTFAKIQTISAGQILSRRTSSGGAVEAQAPGDVLASMFTASPAVADGDVFRYDSATGLLEPHKPVYLVDVTHAIPRRLAGENFGLAITGGAATTKAGVANRMDFFPFSVGGDIAVSAVSVEVTTAVASSLARISIYTASTRANPDTLIDNSADLDCSTTGVKTWSKSYTFLAGTQYWIAIQTSSTTTFRGFASSELLSFGTPAGGGNGYTCLRITATFASGAPASPSGFVSTADTAIKIYFTQA